MFVFLSIENYCHNSVIVHYIPNFLTSHTVHSQNQWGKEWGAAGAEGHVHAAPGLNSTSWRVKGKPQREGGGTTHTSSSSFSLVPLQVLFAILASIPLKGESVEGEGMGGGGVWQWDEEGADPCLPGVPFVLHTLHSGIERETDTEEGPRWEQIGNGPRRHAEPYRGREGGG